MFGNKKQQIERLTLRVQELERINILLLGDVEKVQQDAQAKDLNKKKHEESVILAQINLETEKIKCKNLSENISYLNDEIAQLRNNIEEQTAAAQKERDAREVFEKKLASEMERSAKLEEQIQQLKTDIESQKKRAEYVEKKCEELVVAIQVKEKEKEDIREKAQKLQEQTIEKAEQHMQELRKKMKEQYLYIRSLEEAGKANASPTGGSSNNTPNSDTDTSSATESQISVVADANTNGDILGSATLVSTPRGLESTANDVFQAPTSDETCKPLSPSNALSKSVSMMNFNNSPYSNYSKSVSMDFPNLGLPVGSAANAPVTGESPNKKIDRKVLLMTHFQTLLKDCLTGLKAKQDKVQHLESNRSLMNMFSAKFTQLQVSHLEDYQTQIQTAIDQLWEKKEVTVQEFKDYRNQIKTIDAEMMELLK